jgi:hypothetical protein
VAQGDFLHKASPSETMGRKFRVGDRVEVVHEYPTGWMNRRGAILGITDRVRPLSEDSGYVCLIAFDEPNEIWGDMVDVDSGRLKLLSALDLLAEL